MPLISLCQKGKIRARIIKAIRTFTGKARSYKTSKPSNPGPRSNKEKTKSRKLRN